MSRFGQALLKTLAVTVALLFLAGAVVTAMPSLFGGSKVRTLFAESENALLAAAPVDAGAPKPSQPKANEPEPPPPEPLYMHATKAGPMPVPRPVVDAGAAKVPGPGALFGTPKLLDGGTPHFFPASKSAGGMLGGEGGLGAQQAPQPTQQVQQ